MRRRTAAVAFLLAACTTREAPRDPATAADTPRAIDSVAEWTLGVAGGSGDLGASTTRAAIGARFGSAVRDSSIPVGEGQTERGTIVHPDDPLRRAEVVWADGDDAGPARIQLRGDSSIWSVADGITLGTSLERLEEMNGGPFTLTGFGWDYGGTVMGWGEGALEQALLGGDGRVLLRLAPGIGKTAPPPVSGDGVFRSDLPAMRELEPVVREIIVEYDRPRQ